MNRSQQTAYKHTLVTYITGFMLSLLLTLTAFIVVTSRLFEHWQLTFVILGLAVTQLVVQALFFLHLGEDRHPRWNIKAFLFMLMVVSIVVVGSVWIMENLEYNMMPAHEVDQHIMEEENLYR